MPRERLDPGPARCPEGTVLIPAHCRRVSRTFAKHIQTLQKEKQDLEARYRVLRPYLQKYVEIAQKHDESDEKVLSTEQARDFLKIPIYVQKLARLMTEMPPTIPWTERWEHVRSRITIPPRMEKAWPLLEALLLEDILLVNEALMKRISG